MTRPNRPDRSGRPGRERLTGIGEILGVPVRDRTGELGRIVDVVFWDRSWLIPFFMVESVERMPGGRFPLPPRVFRRSPDHPGSLSVTMTLQQTVEVLEGIPFRFLFSRPAGDRTGSSAEPAAGGPADSPAGTGRLFSFRELKGGRIRVPEGPVGDLEDLVVEDVSWRIRYLKIGNAGRSGTRRVRVEAGWALAVDASTGRISVDPGGTAAAGEASGADPGHEVPKAG